jgi:hypothetical protein
MSAKDQNFSFMGPDVLMQGMSNRDNRSRTFDWNKAAQLIKERQPEVAEAGLSGDWDYTGGPIYRDGLPDTESYTYLESTWATPTLILDGEEIECWSYFDECDFDAHTKWPESALEILNGKD